MLILTRRIDQSIIIGGEDAGEEGAEGIVIMVLGVERDRVKIGITAPDGVRILRDELLTRKPATMRRARVPMPDRGRRLKPIDKTVA